MDQAVRNFLWLLILPASCLCSMPVWAQEPSPVVQEPSPVVQEPLPVTEHRLPSKIVFSFKDADWEDVIQWFADLAGKALLMDEEPSGTFNYFDTREYSVPDAIDVINTVLLDKGFILLIRDNFLQLVDLSDGIPPHLVPRVKIEDLPNHGRTELVKVLITLDGLIAEEAKEEFDQLKGPHGSVIALVSTNQLLVVDTVKSVQQIVDLIREIEVGEGKTDLRAFELRYVSALEMEGVVRDMLGLPPSDQAQTQQSSSGSRSADPRDQMRQMFMERFIGGGDRGRKNEKGKGKGPPGSSESSQVSSNGPFVSVYEPTNTLFVRTTPDKLAMVAEIILKLDVEPQDGGKLNDQTPHIEVYPVEMGTAEGLVEVLGTVLQNSPETRISSHPDDRALIIWASPREHERIREILDQVKTEGLRVEVIPLRVLDAVSAAALIKSVLGVKEETSRPRFSPFDRSRSSSQQPEKPSGPSIEADADRNRLLVRGTTVQIDEVRELLLKLGEHSLAGYGGKGLDRSQMRIVPLGGYDAQELSKRIERLWKGLDNSTPLRIEVLGEPRILQQNDSPSAPTGPHPEIRTPKEPGSASVPYEGAFRFTGAQEQEPGPLPDQLPEKLPEKSTAKPVTIVIDSENLAIISEDPEKLELIENLIHMLLRPESAQTSGFGIYYLQASDAQEMAFLLEEALYGSGSSSPFAPEESPTQARIIPDLRTNSLLVVGPAGEQRKIEQLLDVLDRVDPPETNVVSQTHLIPVLYASARELADVIRGAFAVHLYSQPRQSSQEGQSPGGSFGRGSGSRGSQSRQSSPGKGKLTIGVDEQTNTIVISAPQNIFEEVQYVVRELDDAAKDNQRSIQVVPLRNANPEMIQKALSSLLGTDSSKKKELERPDNRQEPSRNASQNAGQQRFGSQDSRRGGGIGDLIRREIFQGERSRDRSRSSFTPFGRR